MPISRSDNFGRKGRKKTTVSAPTLITTREQYIPKPEVNALGRDALEKFNQTWAHGAPKDNFSKVTRVEVIDAGGRVFSQHYVQAGVTLDLQDDGRTLKIFAGEPTA